MSFAHRICLTAALVAPILSGCATSPSNFYANPRNASDVSLCRALLTTSDARFSYDLRTELAGRGLDDNACRDKVNSQNAAVAAVAIIGLGTAAVIASRNGGGGGGYVAAPRAYGVAWDQFRNQYGQMVWECRDRGTGQFTYDYLCAGKPQLDIEWPGPFA